MHEQFVKTTEGNRGKVTWNLFKRVFFIKETVSNVIATENHTVKQIIPLKMVSIYLFSPPPQLQVNSRIDLALGPIALDDNQSRRRATEFKTWGQPTSYFVVFSCWSSAWKGDGRCQVIWKPTENIIRKKNQNLFLQPSGNQITIEAVKGQMMMTIMMASR